MRRRGRTASTPSCWRCPTTSRSAARPGTTSTSPTRTSTCGSTSPDEGMAELDRIRHQQRRFPVWVTVLGYAVQSAGLALILQPTPWSLVGAAIMGLLVGVLSVLGRRIEAVGYMLPTICAFLVA